MAKLTLLDMTQTLLSRLGSDEVNSITDTTESMQVAEIIKNKYFDILSRDDLGEFKKIFQFTASGDNELPVLMYRPDHINSIEWVKYFCDDDDSDTGDNFQYVTILPIQQFMDMVNNFETTDTNVETYVFEQGADSWTLAMRNDKNPQYATIISNYYVLFDSYLSDVDTTLQASKTMVFGEVFPTWTVEDSFIPELDEQRFPLLVNESLAVAFMELKQVAHPKAEQEIRRQWSASSRARAAAKKPSAFDQLPNFGRKV